MPRVSIITPLYNASKTITETAASVLGQDFEDWEWILFDDGSTDGTQDLAKELEEIHNKKISYFEHEGNHNYGAGLTRNRAVEKSTGELISFIDADDVWNENRLSVQINVLDKNPEAAMIWSPVLYWYRDRSYVQPVEFEGKKIEGGLYYPKKFLEIFLNNLRGTPCPSSTIVRRECYYDVGGYEESLRISEDIALWLKIANSYPIYYLNEVLIKYRKHEGSTLRRAAEDKKIDEMDLKYYKWAINFLKASSVKKEFIEMNEFAYYSCLKKITGKKNYFGSRKELLKNLNSFPELKKKYYKDFFLDLFLPYNLSTRISAKLRFDLFKNK